MRTVAASFGISDVWLAKMCRECGVPTPPPGYWAKKRAGKRAHRRGIPRSLDPDEVVLTWQSGAADETQDSPKPKFDDDVLAALERVNTLDPISVPEDLSKPHRLVSRTRRILRARDKYRDTALIDRSSDGVHREPTPFHVDSSTEARQRVLKVVDALVRGFEAAGNKAVVTEQEQDGMARIKVLGEEFALSIRERLRQRPYDPKVDGEESRWFRPKFVQEPSGRLVLTLECATVRRVHRTWKDSKTRTVEAVLDSVRRTVIRLVQRARQTREEMRVEAERRAEAERLRREREEQRRREEERHRIEMKRVELLLGKAADWAQADQLRRFAAAGRQVAAERSPEGVDPADGELLRWIESVAASLDPLAHGLESVRSATDPSRISAGRY